MSSSEAAVTLQVIDIAPLLAGARCGRKTAGDDEVETASKLDAAAKGSGFMYLTGHGGVVQPVGWLVESAPTQVLQRLKPLHEDPPVSGAGFNWELAPLHHGASRETMGATMEQARRLFALSTEAKQEMRAQSGEGAGWEPSGAQKLDEVGGGAVVQARPPAGLKVFLAKKDH